jgi:hypothetical protein
VFAPPKVTTPAVVFNKLPDPAITASIDPPLTKNEDAVNVPFVTEPASKVNTPAA